MTGQELLPILQSIFPEARISFGYIGNCGPNGEGYENLSWRFFTKLPRIFDGFYNNQPSVRVDNPKEIDVAYVIRELCRYTGKQLSVSDNQILNAL